jgi:hypothetical protein
MKLPTPLEVADQLLNDAHLTEDQANVIAAEIYQPLKDQIERLESAILALCGSCDLSDSIKNSARDALYDIDS